MKAGLRNNSSLYRRKVYEEEINPLDGVVNIVDAMLVFACGLMLSLVIYWNVDLEGSKMVQIDKGTDVTQVEEIQDKVEESKNGGDSYEKLGTVYKDPVTGKMYMLEE
ncbi:DUF2149 domain-containing protein [Anaerovorax odorimutans]|uniref:DUF2149 domain-containing protein n=1 Tax=Anaerovorax odorimutans TaxID=109327 RepID=UPI00040D8DC5|nr:DUF2149 domain-containing protein [Anaerovorax odorimutans]